VVTAGVHVLTEGQKVRLQSTAAPAPAAAAASVALRPGSPWTATPRPPRASRFNISRWALEHPALTRYLLVVLMVLGLAAYFQLGQDEDPPFTFRAMVVTAFWPGASAQQMADQVTDKIEKTLQEVPYADKIRSYTAGRVADHPAGEGLDAAARGGQQLVPGAQAHRRHARTLPAGVIGPVFNDDFGDVYGSIFALSADGFSPEELRQQAERVRQRCCACPTWPRSQLFGVQAERVFVEISQKRLAQLGLDMNQVLGQLGAQNAVEGAGVLNAGAERLQVRIGGQFQSVDELSALADPRRQPGHRRRPARSAWATSPRSNAPMSTRRR
jgi:multidrug efflux pump